MQKKHSNPTETTEFKQKWKLWVDKTLKEALNRLESTKIRYKSN